MFQLCQQLMLVGQAAVPAEFEAGISVLEPAQNLIQY
jgi:hypothetical protein